jgi:hypothetical protein
LLKAAEQIHLLRLQSNFHFRKLVFLHRRSGTSQYE